MVVAVTADSMSTVLMPTCWAMNSTIVNRRCSVSSIVKMQVQFLWRMSNQRWS